MFQGDFNCEVTILAGLTSTFYLCRNHFVLGNGQLNVLAGPISTLYWYRNNKGLYQGDFNYEVTVLSGLTSTF